MTNKKNLRRVSVVVTTQTLYHLNHMAAMNGWGERDLGRVIDKLVQTLRVDQKGGVVHDRARFYEEVCSRQCTMAKEIENESRRVCRVCRDQ